MPRLAPVIKATRLFMVCHHSKRPAMAYNDLREFVSALERAGELKRVPFEVDPYLEITEFADRSVKHGGPALLFERPKGSSVPVLINAFASMRRMEIALQVISVDEVAARISEFLRDADAAGAYRQAEDAAEAGRNRLVLPENRRIGPCKEVIRRDNFSLAELPVLHCWPLDGGPFITLPMVFSKNPETGKRNCGMYRMQVYDDRTTGMHWQTHKQGAEHYRRLLEQGKTRWTSRLRSAPILPRCIPRFCRCLRISTR